ncbi:MAG: HlyD family efflux transporter periplasmic adaptor subunit [Rhodobacterales bacterium]|nr:HlyD family efflux transporter periplasmic adaptor subunit [Rhodobacterales bacterium]
MKLSKDNLRKAAPWPVAAAALLAAWWFWTASQDEGPGPGFASGNGRIEATEINIATKIPGRVEEILVREGDFVTAGEPLARMQIDTLEAQREEASASHDRAIQSVAVAKAQVALATSDAASAQAIVRQREAELEAAKQRLARSETLSAEGASSQQELDDDRARVRSVEAALAASKAQASAARAGITAAEAQVAGAESAVKAAEATITRIDADITDSQLIAPRDGRIQFRVAQTGEVLGAGGTVLNMVDLSDVYMTFFLPEQTVGRIAIGSEARIILDAAPEYVIPAEVSFVSSTAQFTPKTVETESERQKLMFRVRAQIPPDLLRQHLAQVKTGVPGIAWVKVDPAKEWPESLKTRVGD